MVSDNLHRRVRKNDPDYDVISVNVHSPDQFRNEVTSQVFYCQVRMQVQPSLESVIHESEHHVPHVQLHSYFVAHIYHKTVY